MTDIPTLNYLISIMSILIGLFGIILALRFRRRRLLIYSFPIRRQIFSNEYLNIEDFNFLLNGKPVRDIFLVELRIENKGNETLYRQDFLDPVKLVFNKKVNVFPVNIYRKKADVPYEHTIGIDGDSSFFELKTDLIEPGDTFIINLLYESDSYSDYKVQCRITNGKLKYRYQYEETIDENYHYRIYRKYKGIRKFFTMIVTVGLFFFLTSALKGLFPILFSKEVPIYVDVLRVILISITLILLMIPSMWIVDKYFDKKSKREVDEIESFIRER
jgi:hypothetical protein